MSRTSQACGPRRRPGQEECECDCKDCWDAQQASGQPEMSSCWGLGTHRKAGVDKNGVKVTVVTQLGSILNLYFQRLILCYVHNINFKIKKLPGMMAYTFNPRCWKAEIGRALSSGKAWST